MCPTTIHSRADVPSLKKTKRRRDEETKTAEEKSLRKRQIEIDRAIEEVGRVRSLLEPYFNSSAFDIEGSKLWFTIKVNCDPLVNDYIRVWSDWLTGIPSSGLNLEIHPGKHRILEPVCEYDLTDERILELAGLYFEVVTEYVNDSRERANNSPRAKQLDAVIVASNEESAQFRKLVPWISGGIVVGLLILSFG